MHKRLNIRFLACLLASLLVLAVGVHFLHGFQVKRNAGTLLTQADLAKEKGKWAEAADYLRRYLRLVPSNREVLTRYALLLADEKLLTSPRAYFRALYALDNAVRHSPERAEVRRRLVDLAMHDGVRRYVDAMGHLEILRQANGNDAELFGLMGRCQEEGGHFGKARDWYEKAVRLAPKSIEHAARLAHLLQRRAVQVAKRGENVYAVAKAVIDGMVEQNAEVAAAYLTRARYLQAFTQPDTLERDRRAAAQDIRTALAKAPKDLDVLLAAADLAREQADHATARRHLADAVKYHGKDWRPYQAQARLESEQGRIEEAIAALRGGLKRLPGQLDLLWGLVHLLAEKGETKEADEVITRLAKAGFGTPELDYLRARVHIGQSEWLMGARLLEQVYPKLLERSDPRTEWFTFNLGQQCTLLLGLCYERLGDTDRAATAYGRAVAREPRSVPARMGVARTQWALGNLDAAAGEFRLLRRFPGSPMACWTDGAQVLILKNLKHPRPDWAEVEQILDQAERLWPKVVEVSLLRAEVLVARKDLGGAAARLERDHPDKATRPVEVWVSLANLAERHGGKAASPLALLDEAQKHLGDRVELRLARARYWSRQEGPQAAEALARLAPGEKDFSLEQRLQLLRGLAIAHADRGDKKEAELFWIRYAKLQPGGNVGSKVILFDLAAERNAFGRMDQLIGELRYIEGDEGTLWRYGQAARLIREVARGKLPVSDKEGRAKLDEAAALLDYVASRRAGWAARVAFSRGQIHDLRGEYFLAVSKYYDAVMLGDRRPELIYRALELMHAQQRLAEADALMETLRQQGTALTGLERFEADIALYKGDTKTALVRARKAVSEKKSTDYRDYLLLGQYADAAGEKEEAQRCFVRALAENNQVAETWVAYVRHLVAAGEKEKAREQVRKAEGKFTPGNAALGLGQCYEAIGELDQAKKLYETALRKAPEDLAVLQNLARFTLAHKDPNDPKGANRYKKAMRYLGKIVRLEGGSRGERDAARRTLALLKVADAEDYRQIQQALAEIGLAEKSQAAPGREGGAEAAADQRARALILASQPNLRDRRQAVALLEGLRRHQQLDASEQFALARLYEQTGNWRKSRDEMLSLLISLERKLGQASAGAVDLENAYRTALAEFCTSLVRHKVVNDAQVWFGKLEKADPKGYGTLAVKARLLAGQGKAAEAVPALRDLAGREPRLILPIAKLLEDLGQAAAGEELLRGYSDANRAKKPESVLVLARFLGRQNRVGDALALCADAWKSCPAELVGGSCVAILYTGKPTAAECERVARWIQDAVAADPKQLPLLEHLAAVRRLQGRHDEAIGLHQRLLTENKAQARTLNNIAWLQALCGKGAEAMDAIRRAIDIAGPVGYLLDTRGVVYLTQGQADLAVKDFQEAVEEAPDAHRYFHLAQAHRAAKDRSAAVAALRQARALGLTEATVDPLERAAYARVCAELDRR